MNKMPVRFSRELLAGAPAELSDIVFLTLEQLNLCARALYSCEFNAKGVEPNYLGEYHSVMQKGTTLITFALLQEEVDSPVNYYINKMTDDIVNAFNTPNGITLFHRPTIFAGMAAVYVNMKMNPSVASFDHLFAPFAYISDLLYKTICNRFTVSGDKLLYIWSDEQKCTPKMEEPPPEYQVSEYQPLIGRSFYSTDEASLGITRNQFTFDAEGCVWDVLLDGQQNVSRLTYDFIISSEDGVSITVGLTILHPDTGPSYNVSVIVEVHLQSHEILQYSSEPSILRLRELREVDPPDWCLFSLIKDEWEISCRRCNSVSVEKGLYSYLTVIHTASCPSLNLIGGVESTALPEREI